MCHFHRLLSRLFLSLVFRSLVMMYLDLNFSGFILYGVFVEFLGSVRFISLLALQSFQLFPNIFAPFSSPSETPVTQILNWLFLPMGPKALFILFFYVFFSLCHSDWIISIDLSSGSLPLFFVISILLWSYPMSFFSKSFTVFYSSKFLFNPSLCLPFFGERFYFPSCFKSVCDCLLEQFYKSCFRTFVRSFHHLCHSSI